MNEDIQTLFARDPLGLSDQDFERIIVRFREAAKQFSLGNTSAGSTKPLTEKQKQTISLADKLNLNLDL